MARCTSCGKQAGFGSIYCRQCEVRKRDEIAHRHQSTDTHVARMPNRRIVLRIEGNPILAGSFGEELTITNTGVEANVVRGLRRVTMTLPFNRVAQVNLARGIASAHLEVVNKGGQDSIVVRGLAKKEAENAKRIIEGYLAQPVPSAPPSSVGVISVADELRKLAELLAQGVLSDAEFQQQKARLLTMS